MNIGQIVWGWPWFLTEIQRWKWWNTSICWYVFTHIYEFVEYFKTGKTRKFNFHQSINSVQIHSTFKPKIDIRYRWTEKGPRKILWRGGITDGEYKIYSSISVRNSHSHIIQMGCEVLQTILTRLKGRF